MPVQSAICRLSITRPQIYFGELTNTDVYVKTNQKEFDYPQGESDAYTIYDGTGGIPVGSGLRRLALAWALDDLTKLPFSDDVTAESRVLMRRNILTRVQTLAPFLRRALFGPEKLGQRCRALIHTYLGVYYALQLQRRRVRHIHIHHGYFSAWIGMIAARVLGRRNDQRRR